MLQNINTFKLSALMLAMSGLALSACSSSHASGRYASSTASHASAACYADCGVRWVNRVIAIPTTHTIETKYVEQPATVEYVDREVIKEVIKEVVVEKEVPVMRQPCPAVSYPQPERNYYAPASEPMSMTYQEDCYPQPVTPWTPPLVLRK